MWSWRHIKSYFSETLVEEGNSEVTPGLQVQFAYGRLMLNSACVNYSYGRLDAVFREAFEQIAVGKHDWRSALLLGLGAGNVPRILSTMAPGLHVTGVEIDPEVLRLGEKHFGLVAGPRLDIVCADAIRWVEAHDTRYDLVVVDLFVDDQVPAGACHAAFLEQLAQRVNAGGMLLFNRLAHTGALRQQSEDFGRKMVATLPGSYALKADLNLVWVYEKK